LTVAAVFVVACGAGLLVFGSILAALCLPDAPVSDSPAPENTKAPERSNAAGAERKLQCRV
jgi:hypothetical protein